MAIVGAVLASLHGLALAQTTAGDRAQGPAAAQTNARDRARARLVQGGKQYERGDFAAALKSFEAAQTIFPSGKVYYNIALAYRGLGKPAKAVGAVRRFLQDPGDATPQLLGDGRALLEQLSKKVAFVWISSDAEPADVIVDGARVGSIPASAALPLDPGRHEILLSSPTAGMRTRIVEVTAGQSTQLRVNYKEALAYKEASASGPASAATSPASVRTGTTPAPAAAVRAGDRPSSAAATEELIAVGGKRQEVAVSMEKGADADPSGAPAARTTTPLQPMDDRSLTPPGADSGNDRGGGREFPLRPAAWAAGSTAVALMGLGVFETLQYRRHFDHFQTYEVPRKPGQPPSALRDCGAGSPNHGADGCDQIYSNMRFAKRLAIAGYAAGAIAGAGAIALWLLAPTSTPAASELACAPSLGGAGCRFTF